MGFGNRNPPSNRAIVMATKVKKPLKLPKVLCGLGRAISVECGDTKYKWTTKDKVQLYSSTNGKTLYCLKVVKLKTDKTDFTRRIEQNQTAVNAGVKLYEKWHEFDAATGDVMKTPRGFLFNIGRATSLVYASDKWSGKVKHYIHEFKSTPIVWVNNKTAPTVLILTGGRINVKKEGITG